LTALKLSVGLPPAADIGSLGELAEKRGYSHVWCYDSPGLYCDVWMALTQVALRTNRIGLGPGVLVPSLRHPMVNAAAISTLAALAPGRVSVAIGSGFTGRMVLGRRPMPWDDVETYARTLRSLLHGEETTWDGAALRMLHPPGFGMSRPVDVPLLIAADGPKGFAVADAIGDGVISTRPPRTAPTGPWAVMQIGTVLEPDETSDSVRVKDAVSPGLTFAYHSAYCLKGADAVRRLPGGDRWLDVIEATPPERRHLAIHEGHATTPNEADKVLLDHVGPLIDAQTLTADPAGIRARLDRLASAGVTEVIYQPAGPDLERELIAMAAAAGLLSARPTTTGDASR
jgi:5,10-methylenetetrahydromethanopterin reductase